MLARQALLQEVGSREPASGSPAGGSLLEVERHIIMPGAFPSPEISLAWHVEHARPRHPIALTDRVSAIRLITAPSG
ncbi:MAG: hypothetical protein H0W02_11340 [Ktedonobacteraceae bacterium]|nr:hypothetical protein [Ktedonobacteraceae bacterium]